MKISQHEKEQAEKIYNLSKIKIGIIVEIILGLVILTFGIVCILIPRAWGLTLFIVLGVLAIAGRAIPRIRYFKSEKEELYGEQEEEPEERAEKPASREYQKKSNSAGKRNYGKRSGGKGRYARNSRSR